MKRIADADRPVCGELRDEPTLPSARIQALHTKSSQHNRRTAACACPHLVFPIEMRCLQIGFNGK
jgi:hypothetical protein